MAINLADMMRTGGAKLETRGEKLVIKISWDEIVNGIIAGMSQQAKHSVRVNKTSDGIEFEIDAQLLSQVQTLFKP